LIKIRSLKNVKSRSETGAIKTQVRFNAVIYIKIEEE
jgi:hypothetical protein